MQALSLRSTQGCAITYVTAVLLVVVVPSIPDSAAGARPRSRPATADPARRRVRRHLLLVGGVRRVNLWDACVSTAETWARRVGQRVVVRYRLPDGSATDVVGELLRADAAALVVAGRQGEITVALADVVAGKVVPPRPSRPAPPHRALTIADLERVMAGHWLPADHERLGDWLLRAAGGFTNRGNSVLVNGSPGMPAATAVEYVSAWYATRGLPPRAAVPAPDADSPDADSPDADSPDAGSPDAEAGDSTVGRQAFVSAGWQPLSGVGAVVLTAATRQLAAAALALPAGLALDLADTPDEQWRTLYRYRGQVLPASALELLMSAPELTFLSIRAGSRTVATGAAPWRPPGWASPPSRWPPMLGGRAWPGRPGGHRPVGRARGARSAYLQVGDGNDAGRRLYRSAGFSPHHRYDYLSPGPA